MQKPCSSHWLQNSAVTTICFSLMQAQQEKLQYRLALLFLAFFMFLA